MYTRPRSRGRLVGLSSGIAASKLQVGIQAEEVQESRLRTLEVA